MLIGALRRLGQAESEGRIHVGGSGQTARIWAVEMQFPPNESFTFDIRYDVDDETEVSTVSNHSHLVIGSFKKENTHTHQLPT